MSIRLEHVSYAYEDNSSKKNYALKDVNLEIKKEEFIAAKVKEKYHITTELINDVGAVIGAHSGPGTMALFFVGDVR